MAHHNTAHIVGPRVRRRLFLLHNSRLPSRAAFTTSNDVSHRGPVWIICRCAGKGPRSDVWHLFNFIAVVVKKTACRSCVQSFSISICTARMFALVRKIQLTALLSNSKSSFYLVPRYFTQQTNSCCDLYGNLNNTKEYNPNRKKNSYRFLTLVLMWVDMSDEQTHPQSLERMSPDC